jgi:uncharacterized protein
MDAGDAIALADWRRRVGAMYTAAREAAVRDPAGAWAGWRRERDELFRTHPQSPVPPDRRDGLGPLSYFDHDPGLRVLADVRPVEPRTLRMDVSTGEPVSFTRVGRCEFALASGPAALELFWLEGYGGGLFLPFRDATGGTETYGAGRYLLDTVKGADLGTDDRGRLVLDFNFAYNPSCAYDPRWSCPLAPPANRLPVEIRAGERTPPL